MVTNRKLLQLAGSTLAKIKALTGDDALQPREIVVATDTGNIVLGLSDGKQAVIGSTTRGTTEERTAADPISGSFFFDTTEGKLYIGSGTAWQAASPTIKVDDLHIEDLMAKDADAVAGNLAVFDNTGSVVDSTYKIDDSKSTNKVLWTAEQILEAIDNAVNGLSWQKPVKEVVTELPESPEEGDRYLVLGGESEQEGQIVEFDGSAWVASAPIDGTAVFVQDTDKQYAYNGTEWVNIHGGFNYSAGNGLELTDNKFAVVAKENGGIVVDTDGVSIDLDDATLVVNEDGKVEVGTLDFGEF